MEHRWVRVRLRGGDGSGPIRGRGRGAGRGDDTPDSQTAQQPNDSNTPVTPHPGHGPGSRGRATPVRRASLRWAGRPRGVRPPHHRARETPHLASRQRRTSGVSE